MSAWEANITPEKLKLDRVTKVKVFFVVLVYVLILANFNFFEFLAAILEKGVLTLGIQTSFHVLT